MGAFLGGGGYLENLLTAIVINGSLVRSIVSHASGFYYFEATFNTASDLTHVGIGVDNDTESLTNSGGQTGSIIWLGSGIVNYNGSSRVYAAQSFGIGDILGIAVDITNKFIWFRVNGGNWNLSGTADPVSIVGGFSIAAVTPTAFAYAQLENMADQVTANFSGPFTDLIPSSPYTNW
jgi:hypothetical protein